MIKKLAIPYLLLLSIGMLSSCSSTRYLNVSAVAYQSLRAKHAESSILDIPKDATIIVSCQVGPNGEFEVLVKNNSDKVMTIDRTRSFFRNQSGNSLPYYDSTVRVQSQSTMVGAQTGANVNLGNIASAAGIGGALGTALGGINVGGSQESATSTTNTTYMVDQPQIFVAPHGQVSMGRTFYVEGVGLSFLSDAASSANVDVNNEFTPEHTYASCNLCISYSIDDGNTFDTILTDIYANSLLVSKVKQIGRVNDALRNIYINKVDALVEPWYALYFHSDAKKNNNKVQVSQFLNFK